MYYVVSRIKSAFYLIFRLTIICTILVKDTSNLNIWTVVRDPVQQQQQPPQPSTSHSRSYL